MWDMSIPCLEVESITENYAWSSSLPYHQSSNIDLTRIVSSMFFLLEIGSSHMCLFWLLNCLRRNVKCAHCLGVSYIRLRYFPHTCVFMCPSFILSFNCRYCPLMVSKGFIFYMKISYPSSLSSSVLINSCFIKRHRSTQTYYINLSNGETYASLKLWPETNCMKVIWAMCMSCTVALI